MIYNEKVVKYIVPQRIAPDANTDKIILTSLGHSDIIK
jgi:hypothetical protein